MYSSCHCFSNTNNECIFIANHVYCYFVPGRGAEYCSQYVCMSSVYLFVALLTYLKNHLCKLHSFRYVLPVAMAQPSSNNAIRFVLSVLWLTSCFQVMGLTQIQAIGKLFTLTCHMASLNAYPKQSLLCLTACHICFHPVIMVALWNRADRYIFMLWFVLLLLLSFFFFPRLISAAADWMSAILPHTVWP